MAMKKIYFRKMAKRTLRVLPVIFLSMAGLLILVLGCLQALKEDGKVKVGVIVPTEDTMTMAFVNTIGSMGEISSICEFSMITEQEGKEKLEQGEVSALLVIPENILQKIYRNENTKIQMYTPEEPTLDSALMQEFAETASSLVLTAKAGDFSAYNLYRKYGKEGSMKKVATDMNGNYIRFVMRQETLFTDRAIMGREGMSDEERLIVSVIILVLFLLGIPIVQLRTRQSASLSLQLARKGVSSVFSLAVDMVLIAFSLFVVLLAGVAVFAFALEMNISIRFLPCLLLDSLCGAAFLSMFCALNQGTAGSVLAIFLVSVIQFFLSGGIFPVYALPAGCARIGEVLPGGMMMDALYSGMFYGKWRSSVVVVVIYILIFFLVSLFLKEQRRRNCT